MFNRKKAVQGVWYLFMSTEGYKKRRVEITPDILILNRILLNVEKVCNVLSLL